MRLPLLLLASLCLWAGFPAAPAEAQQQGVQRCTTMDGDTVYTDKNCEDIGAMDRLPAGTTGPSATGALYRGGCSRTLSDLVAQVSMAITAGDVNRLAGVYHWSGMSDAAALRILDQLDAVVQRPLVDIVPVRPAPAPILDAEGAIVDFAGDPLSGSVTYLVDLGNGQADF